MARVPGGTKGLIVGVATSLSVAGPACAQTPVTLTFAAHYNPAEMAPLTACFRAYEESHPNIRIRYQQSPIAEFLQTIQTSRLGGTSPDIYNVYSIWGAKLVGNGILAEPPSDIGSFIDSQYVASTVRSATVQNKVWGVPAEVSLYMLVYNKKLFAQAGIDHPPATLDEVVDDAAKITKRDGLGKITIAGYAFGPTVANATHPFRSLLFSTGQTLYDANGTSTHLKDPGALAVLTKEVELFRRGLTSASNQVRDFPSGSVGMMITANWFKQTLKDGLGAAFDETVGVAPIPGGPDWRTYQYSFYQAVDSKSPHAAEAWAFIRWLNTPRDTGKRSCVGDMLVKLGALTANRSDLAASASDYGDAFAKPYVDALASGRAIADPNLVETAEADAALRTALDEAWLGRKSPADALSQADSRISAILSAP